MENNERCSLAPGQLPRCDSTATFARYISKLIFAGEKCLSFKLPCLSKYWCVTWKDVLWKRNSDVFPVNCWANWCVQPKKPEMNHWLWYIRCWMMWINIHRPQVGWLLEGFLAIGVDVSQLLLVSVSVRVLVSFILWKVELFRKIKALAVGPHQQLCVDILLISKIFWWYVQRDAASTCEMA